MKYFLNEFVETGYLSPHYHYYIISKIEYEEKLCQGTFPIIQFNKKGKPKKGLETFYDYTPPEYVKYLLNKSMLDIIYCHDYLESLVYLYNSEPGKFIRTLRYGQPVKVEYLGEFDNDEEAILYFRLR